MWDTLQLTDSPNDPVPVSGRFREQQSGTNNFLFASQRHDEISQSNEINVSSRTFVFI